MQFNIAATVLLFIGLAQAGPAIKARQQACPPKALTPMGPNMCTAYSASVDQACVLSGPTFVDGYQYTLCSDPKWQ